MTRTGDRRHSEAGFVLIYALGVMLVVMTLSAAAFAAVRGDIGLTHSDLDGKRAYSSAEAGIQYYLGQLNQHASDSSWWQTCANDSASNVAVPGVINETYSYSPVKACVAGGAVGTVLDASTGVLRMRFTGSSGTAGTQRSIVADFRPVSPLSFLWFTAHETVDPAVYSGCNGNTYSSSSPPASTCWIQWATGDTVNGPLYTQDQLLVQPGAAPVFGRGSQDLIETPNPKLCVSSSGSTLSANTCPVNNGQSVIKGRLVTNAQSIQLPPDNSNLINDAQYHGVVLPQGTTTLNLTGSSSPSPSATTATAVTCTSATSCTSTPIPASTPIIYAPNASGCTAGGYNPTYNTYSNQITSGSNSGDFYGACGDVYVKGTYATSMTIAAGNDIVVTGNLTDTTYANGLPSGSATLGLVANQFVRVYHPVTFTYDSQGNPTSCSASAGQNTTIDAAILNLHDSFYADNYECGPPGTLTVHGAIAQNYRGIVAQSDGNNGVAHGFVKSYTYDDRLRYILPAYLFDLQSTSWQTLRETLCSPATSDSSSCTYGS